MKPKHARLLYALLDDAMVRHRVRGRLPDDLGAWMADLKDITNGAPPIPEPSEPTAWLGADAAADLLAAAGVGIGDRQVRSLAASGKLLARPRRTSLGDRAGVRRGRDRCPPVLRPEVSEASRQPRFRGRVRVTLYRPLPVIGGTMATWAEQQRRAKIAELVKQSRADERRAQALEDRIRYGNEGTFQEMWTRGLEEDVRQERAENDVREAKLRRQLELKAAAERADHERRVAALCGLSDADIHARLATLRGAGSTPSTRQSTPASRQSTPTPWAGDYDVLLTRLRNKPDSRAQINRALVNGKTPVRWCASPTTAR